MNILYIAPRYHTNQVPIVKGWINEGNNVKFISQYEGKIEDHTFLEPHILGYSKIFLFLNKMYSLVKKKELENSANTVAFQVKCGFPSIRKLRKAIIEFEPDVVILRERSAYSTLAYFICRVKKYKVILYNQTPLWGKQKHNNFKNIISKIITPDIRITPVVGRKKGNLHKEKNAYFVPFVMENQVENSKREYFQGNKINIICVGKYEKRKNQIMLLGLFKELSQKYEILLTLVGEVSTEHHKEYFLKIKTFIAENELKEKVKVFQNLLPEEVIELYKKSDLFILPSTKEMASVSQLEAMACGLPIICSDTNGTACYIEEGLNGYLFEDEKSEDLKSKIEMLVIDKTKIVTMGEKSSELTKEKYSFEAYQKVIKRIMEI